MKKITKLLCRSTVKSAFFIALFASFIGRSAESIAQAGYITGDFHQHSTYTDGSWTIGHVMSKNNQFGLNWWSNSEHGGAFNRNGNISGRDTDSVLYWDQDSSVNIKGMNSISGGHRNMWRWQSIKELSFIKVLETRYKYWPKQIFQGVEWNVPGHEHASVTIITNEFGRFPNANAVAEFEYKFDNNDKDTIGGIEFGWTKSKLSGHDKTLEGIAWLEKYHTYSSWVIPAHPERKKLYDIKSFRDMNNAGPNVCFGFESIPGHQRSSNRGEYSSACNGGGTYGGSGYFSAKIGGLWDAMLTEGRHFWLFSNSDFHDTINDFYPGQYQKNNTYVSNRRNPNAIVNGLRSGKNWVVSGDLIDQLNFNISDGHSWMSKTVSMGGNLTYNKKIFVTIIARDPNTNNYFGQNPILDHIDLIMGKVNGIISPESPEYEVDSVTTTKVVARFDSKGSSVDINGLKSTKWTKLKNGLILMQYEICNPGDVYFRLRGTNMKINTEGQTDAAGNPLLDIPGTNNEASAIADLWFYSNPIFAAQKNKNNNNWKSTEEINITMSDNGNGVNIYPNPASTFLCFENLTDLDPKVEIYDMSGILVMNSTINNNSIDISPLKKGVYLVKVNNNMAISILRLIKE